MKFTPRTLPTLRFCLDSIIRKIMIARTRSLFTLYRDSGTNRWSSLLVPDPTKDGCCRQWQISPKFVEAGRPPHRRLRPLLRIRAFLVNMAHLALLIPSVLDSLGVYVAQEAVFVLTCPSELPRNRARLAFRFPLCFLLRAEAIGRAQSSSQLPAHTITRSEKRRRAANATDGDA